MQLSCKDKMSETKCRCGVLCCLQMEVTFNFLEIRAMNTYPEHQVRTLFFHHLLPASGLKCYNRKNSCLYATGCHRHRQDHLLSEAADPGPAGSRGQPHQLRPLPSLQQLHLRVSIPEHRSPRAAERAFLVFCFVRAEERRQVGRR